MSNLWSNFEVLKKFKSELLCFLCYKLYIKYTPELADILSFHSEYEILFHLKKYKENATYNPLSRDVQLTINFAVESEDDIDSASIINGWSIYDLKYLNILPIYKEPKKELPKQFQDIGTSVLLYIKNQFDHKKFKYLNINKNYTSKLYPEICHLFQLNSSQKQNFTETQLLKNYELKQSSQGVSFITITNLCHFNNISTMVKIIKKTLCKGGYLLIKDYDLKHHDHIYLYDAFYDLYKLLLDDVPIKQILNHKKNNYKSLYDWIYYLNTYGFNFVAKCTTPIDKTHHGDIYMLFKKT